MKYMHCCQRQYDMSFHCSRGEGEGVWIKRMFATLSPLSTELICFLIQFAAANSSAANVNFVFKYAIASEAFIYK